MKTKFYSYQHPNSPLSLATMIQLPFVHYVLLPFDAALSWLPTIGQCSRVDCARAVAHGTCACPRGDCSVDSRRSASTRESSCFCVTLNSWPPRMVASSDASCASISRTELVRPAEETSNMKKRLKRDGQNFKDGALQPSNQRNVLAHLKEASNMLQVERGASSHAWAGAPCEQ